MKFHNSVVIPVLTLWLLSCSLCSCVPEAPTSLNELVKITSDLKMVPADGKSEAKIAVQLKVPKGKQPIKVTLSTTLGTLLNAKDEKRQTAEAITDSDGVAYFTLLSGTKPGLVKLIAEFEVKPISPKGESLEPVRFRQISEKLVFVLSCPTQMRLETTPAVLDIPASASAEVPVKLKVNLSKFIKNQISRLSETTPVSFQVKRKEASGTLSTGRLDPPLTQANSSGVAETTLLVPSKSDAGVLVLTAIVDVKYCTEKLKKPLSVQKDLLVQVCPGKLDLDFQDSRKTIWLSKDEQALTLTAKVSKTEFQNQVTVTKRLVQFNVTRKGDTDGKAVSGLTVTQTSTNEKGEISAQLKLPASFDGGTLVASATLECGGEKRTVSKELEVRVCPTSLELTLENTSQAQVTVDPSETKTQEVRVYAAFKRYSANNAASPDLVTFELKHSNGSTKTVLSTGADRVLTNNSGRAETILRIPSNEEAGTLTLSASMLCDKTVVKSDLKLEIKTKKDTTSP